MERHIAPKRTAFCTHLPGAQGLRRIFIYVPTTGRGTSVNPVTYTVCKANLKKKESRFQEWNWASEGPPKFRVISLMANPALWPLGELTPLTVRGPRNRAEVSLFVRKHVGLCGLPPEGMQADSVGPAWLCRAQQQASRPRGLPNGSFSRLIL